MKECRGNPVTIKSIAHIFNDFTMVGVFVVLHSGEAYKFSCLENDPPPPSLLAVNVSSALLLSGHHLLSVTYDGKLISKHSGMPEQLIDEGPFQTIVGSPPVFKGAVALSKNGMKIIYKFTSDQWFSHIVQPIKIKQCVHGSINVVLLLEDGTMQIARGASHTTHTSTTDEPAGLSAFSQLTLPECHQAQKKITNMHANGPTLAVQTNDGMFYVCNTRADPIHILQANILGPICDIRAVIPFYLPDVPGGHFIYTLFEMS